MTSRGRKNAMGTFQVWCRIENHIDRSKGTAVPKLLVDTGSDYTWIPSALLDRIGVEREKKELSFVRLDRYFTIDEVVFAEPGDLPLLGARSLEGLNLTVDPKRKRLVASGPLHAAAV